MNTTYATVASDTVTGHPIHTSRLPRRRQRLDEATRRALLTAALRDDDLTRQLDLIAHPDTDGSDWAYALLETGKDWHPTMADLVDYFDDHYVTAVDRNGDEIRHLKHRLHIVLSAAASAGTVLCGAAPDRMAS